MKAKRRVSVLGVPSDLGASKQGSAGGPAAIRRADLLDLLKNLDLSVEDLGDVPAPASSSRSSSKLKNGAAILKLCENIEKRVHSIVKNGALPLTIGGDHSLAMGTVCGVARAYREKKKKIGLIWADAHADINTPETTTTGNVHGMPLAHILGLGDRNFSDLGGFKPKVEPRNVVLIGIRDVDRAEAEILRRSGARVFSMMEIDRFGMANVIEQALDVACDGTAGFHLSFDIDVVDPGSAPGTGTLKRGGLSYREAHLLMELVAESKQLLGLDLVEVNPLEDVQNSTAVVAAELIASALGKRIY